MNEQTADPSNGSFPGRETKCIPPGSTIGILGGGQLGRMLAMEAAKMGYKVGVLDPQQNPPASQVANFSVQADFTDGEALRAFSQRCDVLTFEFENVSAKALSGALGEGCLVHPAPGVLHITQNREREKTFLKENQIPCAEFEIIASATDLSRACQRIGFPCVLKTADFGYDGKGQLRLDQAGDPDSIWDRFDAPRAVLEAWVPYVAEISVICARWADGRSVLLPPAKNLHRNHILHQSSVPAGLSQATNDSAAALAGKVAEKLEVVGLVAVEMFLLEGGEILVNELAPRPHNSGHYSFDAMPCGQFEQHIRAICNLPPGSSALFSPVVMINLLGDLWRNGVAPDWRILLEEPDAKLHLYGKEEAKPGRKMGHFCVMKPTIAEAEATAGELFARLSDFGNGT